MVFFPQGHIGIVEILVVAGGDASIKNSERKTALKLAKDKRQTHVVYYLHGVEKEQIHAVNEEIKERKKELVEAYHRAIEEARHRVFQARVFTICPPHSTDDLSIHDHLVMPPDEDRDTNQTVHINPVRYSVTANQSTPWEAPTESPKSQYDVYSKAIACYIMHEILKYAPIVKANVSQQDLRRKAEAERQAWAAKQAQRQTIDSVTEESTEIPDTDESTSQSADNVFPGFDIINGHPPPPRARAESVSQPLPLPIDEVPDNIQKHIIEMWRQVKKTGNTEAINEPGMGDKSPPLSVSVWEIQMNTNSALWRVIWPIIFTHKALYAAVYDLSQAWNQDEGHGSTTRSTAGRNLDIYLRNLCSIVAQVPPHHFTWFGMNRKTQHVAPPFAIVGMHKEISASNDPVVRANLEKVQTKVMDSAVSPHIPDEGKYVFSIPGQNTDEFLRRYIEQTLRNETFYKEAISVNWLLFQHCIDSLKADKKKAMSYDRVVEQIGVKAIKASHLTVNQMLQYCHDHGYVFHFSNSPKLKTIVFLNPQWLLDLLDAVLSLTAHKLDFTLFHALDENPLIVELQETGHIDDLLLKEVSDQFEVERELDIPLCDVLEGFDLLIKIPNKMGGFDCYIPLLASVHVEPDLPLVLNIVEGCVKCYDTYCPFALFYYLAGIYLLRRFSQHGNFRLSKDCVSMKIRANVQLILTEHVDNISVLLICMGYQQNIKAIGVAVETDEQLRQLCAEVNKAIEEGVAMVKARWIPGLLAQLETPLQY